MPPKPPSKSTGRLIVIEGADGTGKTTQLSLLNERLRRAGHQVAHYDFPSKSGSPVGELIGAFLRGEQGEVAPEFLALAFSADRMSRRSQIIDDLTAGRVVLCDRYVASNIAFQSSKINDAERREKIKSLVNWFEYSVLELPMPDLQVVLVAPETHFTKGLHLDRMPDVSRNYTDSADIHEENLDLQLAVNSFYRSLEPSPALRQLEIEQEGVRRTPEELGDLIWELAGETKTET